MHRELQPENRHKHGSTTTTSTTSSSSSRRGSSGTLMPMAATTHVNTHAPAAAAAAAAAEETITSSSSCLLLVLQSIWCSQGRLHSRPCPPTPWPLAPHTNEHPPAWHHLMPLLLARPAAHLLRAVTLVGPVPPVAELPGLRVHCTGVVVAQGQVGPAINGDSGQHLHRHTQTQTQTHSHIKKGGGLCCWKHSPAGFHLLNRDTTGKTPPLTATPSTNKPDPINSIPSTPGGG